LPNNLTNGPTAPHAAETMALSPFLHIEKDFQPKWLLNNELTKTTCVGLIWFTIDLEKRLSLS
jgi:hypothetical protein